MTVKYFGDIRPLTGIKEEGWPHPHPDLRSLLNVLGQKHTALRKPPVRRRSTQQHHHHFGQWQECRLPQGHRNTASAG